MIVFIILIALVIIAAVISVIFYRRKKKYDDFIILNSVSLSALIRINNKYAFNPSVRYDQSHTYDNENFYNDISCEDYLIYQLQYIGKEVLEQIKNANTNSELYTKYIKEVDEIDCFGQFRMPVGKLKINKLLEREKLLMNKAIASRPDVSFDIRVILYCSKINGEVYQRKERYFSSDDILALLKRLKNKNGKFYNDRGIWDSICRIERGKVSNKIRFAIYARDGYRCCRCGISQKYAALEVDHIIPIAKGGKSTYDNLQTLCHKCNVEKGDTVY